MWQTSLECVSQIAYRWMNIWIHFLSSSLSKASNPLCPLLSLAVLCPTFDLCVIPNPLHGCPETLLALVLHNGCLLNVTFETSVFIFSYYSKEMTVLACILTLTHFSWASVSAYLLPHTKDVLCGPQFQRRGVYSRCQGRHMLKLFFHSKWLQDTGVPLKIKMHFFSVHSNAF